MYDWLTDVNRLCEIIFIQMVIQIGPMISVDCHLFLLCSSEEVVSEGFDVYFKRSIGFRNGKNVGDRSRYYPGHRSTSCVKKIN